ncbi:IS66 family insertion sequence element accessory protein TnpB [Legionella tunisiensis]|uniref:IS66 family insertion sequence element accessory protein TnpB n=1 Tax=Legionella tunisiensis TaxID=1034944 RepID=UPI000A0192C3
MCSNQVVRQGIDGLNALCKQRLFNDPFSGMVFAFTNRMHTSIKLLVYEGALSNYILKINKGN